METPYADDGPLELFIIIVANRLPYELKLNDDTGDKEATKSVSGLVTALQNVLDDEFSHQHKVLWLGGMVDNASFLEDERLLRRKNDNIRGVPISMDDCKNHLIWSNDKLWPLFHNAVEHVVSDDLLPSNAWMGYKEVNKKFAEKTMEHTMESLTQGQQPLLWIHDFQLLLVPKLVRQMLASNDRVCPIGFFLHIPFPSPANFEKLAYFEDILEGMLGSSMIGFHTEEFRRNFIDCCVKHMGVRVDIYTTNMKVSYQEREVLVRVIPAGISVDSISGYSCGEFSEECPTKIKELCKTPAVKSIMVGVDRIDYTKGLLHKVRAFQSLLHQFPHFDGLVTYIQIAVPCRSGSLSFKELRSELEDLVNKTNMELSKKGFSSRIEMIFEKVSQQDLAVLYKKADVALVTPLRDGMNLVAMEYVACQRYQAPPGVLILSRFAGAAATMLEALKVDPNCIQCMVHTMHSALSMEPAERNKRMSKLQARVRSQSAMHYVIGNIRAILSSE